MFNENPNENKAFKYKETRGHQNFSTARYTSLLNYSKFLRTNL